MAAPGEKGDSVLKGERMTAQDLVALGELVTSEKLAGDRHHLCAE
jgi:hypothetical protein